MTDSKIQWHQLRLPGDFGHISPIHFADIRVNHTSPGHQEGSIIRRIYLSDCCWGKPGPLSLSIESGGRNIILCLREWVRLKYSKRVSVSEYSQQEREQNVSRRRIQKGRGAST